MRLIYHAGDRFVPGHPADHIETEDPLLVAHLLGARHSDGQRIWTMDANASKDATPQDTAPTNEHVIADHEPDELSEQLAVEQTVALPPNHSTVRP